VPKDSGVKGAILGNVKILGKPQVVHTSDHVPDNPNSDSLPF